MAQNNKIKVEILVLLSLKVRLCTINFSALVQDWLHASARANAITGWAVSLAGLVASKSADNNRSNFQDPSQKKLCLTHSNCTWFQHIILVNNFSGSIVLSWVACNTKGQLKKNMKSKPHSCEIAIHSCISNFRGAVNLTKVL